MGEEVMNSSLVKRYQILIEEELSNLVAQEKLDGHSEAADLVEHVLLAGGKRLRPILVLLTHDLVGGSEIEKVVPLAIAFELIHTATLAHDDLNDRAKTRRGVQTLHERFGGVKALIAGDYLFVLGFALGGDYCTETVNTIASACKAIATSELKQLHHIGNLATKPEDYYAIIEGKTAAPFAAGCRAVVRESGADEDSAARLEEFGLQIGLAFQLVDDLLDLLGDEKLGKPRGTDVLEGKMTLPLIHALTLLHGESRKRLAEVIENYNDSLADELIALLELAGSIEYTRMLAEGHLERAVGILRTFPESEASKELEGLIIEMRERDH